MKKKLLLGLVLIFGLSAMAFAEEEITIDETRWAGEVRFNPAALLLGIISTPSTIGTTVTVAPQLGNFIGIPITVDAAYAVSADIFAIGAYAGLQVTPIEKFAPGGLYISAQAGAMYILNSLSFIAKADIGWQFISGGGFVFLPAAGVRYSELTGVQLDLLLDIGFAF